MLNVHNKIKYYNFICISIYINNIYIYLSCLGIKYEDIFMSYDRLTHVKTLNSSDICVVMHMLKRPGRRNKYYISLIVRSGCWSCRPSFDLKLDFFPILKFIFKKANMYIFLTHDIIHIKGSSMLRLSNERSQETSPTLILNVF